MSDAKNRNAHNVNPMSHRTAGKDARQTGQPPIRRYANPYPVFNPAEPGSTQGERQKTPCHTP
ncbi:MAG: hypothetical protein K8I82_25560 [Anaerolineae bacterium]|nr:hypothetical protein [Anaerolineae bacterium]